MRFKVILALVNDQYQDEVIEAAKAEQADAVFIPGYSFVEERLEPLIASVMSKIEHSKIPFYLLLPFFYTFQ